MKVMLVSIFFFVSLLSRAQNPYVISFQSIEGQTINLSDYASKKILVAACNAASPDTLQLKQIDSFYQANDSVLSLIILPVDDFGTPLEDSVLSVFLRDSLHLHCAIGQTGKGSKTNDSDQQALLKWLTHVSDNMHFDNDITQDGQMYLLSEKGTLFGQFGKTTSPAFLYKALQQVVTD